MSNVVIAGASGLIGSALCTILDGHKLDILVRRPVGNLPDAITQHVAEPSRWPEIIMALSPDIAISCLGTTWKKSGKDASQFRAVDKDLVLAFAMATHLAGASQFIAVSSVGATKDTGNLYLRTKGEVEDSLALLAFDRLDIMRPGLLTGDRRNDRRLGERAAIMVAPIIDRLIPGAFSRFRSIPAFTVARAIAKLVGNGTSGRFIHENEAIRSLAS
ncbi:NAD-dependent epimerase/dehydratase family protein [Sphingorhabdus sp.]|uniref:NAD-dependent epimerase/dehydratase family protein n=1 Tax=Sphingorhabdus sp. TaxID=1902408 RepID=UPI003593F236